jgi:hypothetical protein
LLLMPEVADESHAPDGRLRRLVNAVLPVSCAGGSGETGLYQRDDADRAALLRQALELSGGNQLKPPGCWASTATRCANVSGCWFLAPSRGTGTLPTG